MRLRNGFRILFLRIRIELGFLPNVESIRATLDRQLAIDRAKAHLAVTELECLIDAVRVSERERARG